MTCFIKIFNYLLMHAICFNIFTIMLIKMFNNFEIYTFINPMHLYMFKSITYLHGIVNKDI